MIIIKQSKWTNRLHHTRWSITIPKKETRIDDVQKFFKTKRSEADIIAELKADPNVDIVIVQKAKTIKKDKK